ncbi:MAG: PEP-CTERM sorting domain-containing protein [Fimbriimonadaceae bacterium]|nr:MAG: PEP-CTERM sorting domain-containing protein [Fimbriimonadaceae bacterium]
MNTVTPKNLKLLSSGLLISALACTASASLFSDNFDVDNTAGWQFNSNMAGDTASQADGGSAADFFFDYSTVGISSAPNSIGGTTRGLRMQTAITGTVGAALQHGMSVSPIGQSFSGDYVLKFDAWLNYNGPAPAGGNGSTHLTTAGLGFGTGIQSPVPGITGTVFGTTGDGGTSADWRAYNGSSSTIAPATGTYAAGTQASATNNSDPYYMGLFPGSTIPGAQSALAPATQIGTAAAGTTAFSWRTWEITRSGTTVSWSVDGNLIATVSGAVSGTNNIIFGQSDINNGLSTDPNSLLFQFGLIDNVSVEAVPEPATMTVLAGAAALAALKRRKK